MAENMTNTTANEESVMTKDIFKKTFWRSFPLQACFCYERMQNVGFAYQMVPALKKLYPDKKEASEALKRHLAIFNTTPAIVSFITGAAIAMEEKFKKAKDAGEECDEESINAVKAACGADISVQTEILVEVSDLLADTKNALSKLEEVTAQGAAMAQGREQAVFYRDEVMTAMKALRTPVDKLEMLVDKSMWPMPSYGDLMFEV